MFLTIDLFLAMGFAWMISGMVLLFLNRKNNQAALLPGIILILMFGLTLADNFLKPHMLTPFLIRFVYIFSRNSYFLIGPFLWLYSRSLLAPGGTEKRFFTLHLVPFILWSLFLFINPQDLMPIMNPGPVKPPSGPVSARIIPTGFLRDLTSIISRVIYSVIVLISIIRHGKSVPDFYSRLTIRNTLSWLFYLVLLYVFLFLTNTILLLIPFIPSDIRMSISTIVRILPSILFIFFFSLLAQNQPIPEDRLEPENDDLQERGKYTKSGLTAEESEKLYDELNNHINKTKLYLNPDLTLDDLAGELNESRHRLSEVINRESAENFYSYINSFRLQEFLDSIDEDRFPHYTILAIALECGFKSTSAFYSLFKKSMGRTPKEYMRQRDLTAV